MTDHHDLERRLRRYRPVGPAPGLRDRALARQVQPRAWPWVAAVAAMLAVVLLSHAKTNDIYAMPAPARATADEPVDADVQELRHAGLNELADRLQSRLRSEEPEQPILADENEMRWR